MRQLRVLHMSIKHYLSQFDVTIVEGGMCIYLVGKVATYHHVYRSEPKEPTQFGSVSGSEIQNLLFYNSGIVSLYLSEPKEPT